MRGSPDWGETALDGCRAEWFDPACWAAEIGDAIGLIDPAACNRRVTLAHYRLSLALRAVTGADAGANFHTWAVWGSRKAGATIRREDTRRLRRRLDLACAGLALGAALAGIARRERPAARIGAGVGLAVAAAAPLLLRARLKRTARQILAGNRTVLDDIGGVTGRFVAAFHDRPTPEPERLAAFLATLRPGPTVDGGQDLLRRAFANYHRARYEPDPDAKRERMLLANCCAILHEHIRLEPYIDAAIPRLLRRCVTARLLGFDLGPDGLRVAADVPPWPNRGFPEALRPLADAELGAFLAGPGGWDRTPNDLAGSAAADWTDLADRMNFIVDLFRTRHLDPALFAPPFATAEGLRC